MCLAACGIPRPNTKRATRRWPFAKASSTRGASEAPSVRDDVLLVDQRRYELETVPPHHALNVVRIGPEGMEDVVGAGGDVGVITEEAAAELVAGVNGMRADDVRHRRCDVPNNVVEPRVIDV